MSKEQQRITVVVVLLVVAIIAIVAIITPGSSPQVTPGSVPPVVPGTPTYASGGKLVDGFPQALILDPQAKVTQSYTIYYSSSTNLYAAEWDSSSSLTDLQGKYLEYLPGHGWNITNQTSLHLNSLGLYAQNETSSVSVAITKTSGGSHVTMGYSTGPAPVAAGNSLPDLKIYDKTLIGSFPAQFIIDPSAKILSSSDNPDSATKIHTAAAVYQSDESMDALFTAYTKLFSGASGWRILAQSKESSLATITAVNDGKHEQANVQMQSAASGGTNVVVSVQMPL